MTGEIDQSRRVPGWYRDPDDAARKRYWDGSTWTDQIRDRRRGRTSAPDPEMIEPSSLGIVLSYAGALTIVVSVLLPRASAPVNLRILHNTLLSDSPGVGVVVLLLALLAASGAWAAQGDRVRVWTPIVAGSLAIVAAINSAHDAQSQALYPIGANGEPIRSIAVHASVSFGIYVLGIGGLLALIGGILIRRSPALTTEVPATEVAAASEVKQCPDCAETVLDAARVCKHCGYRFAPDPTTSQ
jgi:hypothetical protein